jgi:putative peptide zinc metalloprotease protein
VKQARAPDMSERLSAALANPMGTVNVWATLRSGIGATRASTPDVWSRLSDVLDPAQFRPKVAEGTEWKRFPLRWGNDHAMVANPDRDMHYDLALWAVDILPLMDGTRTVSDIVIERLDEAGGLDPDAVVELIGSLREGRFLDPRPPNVEAALQRGLDPSRATLGRLRTFVKTLRIEWTGIDAFVGRLYQGGFRVFFKRPVAIVAAVVAAAGLLALASTVLSHRFTLDTRSAPLESLVLIFLSLTLTVAHELGHALVEIHDGRKIGSAGFMIYFGSPTFYVDASDAMMMDRPMRILQSSAGSGAELFLSGIASLLVFFFPSWGAAEFLYRFALLNLFIIFLNLIPLLELDGYWIFSDLVQVKDLRPRSMEFVQHDLWHKVRTRDHVTLQEWGLAFYCLTGIVFTIGSLFISYFFWKQLFGGLVGDLWSGGIASRVLLILLVLFLAGPLIRGAFALGHSLRRRLRVIARRMRFKRETGWRIEAAELIDALPAFADLPEEILNDLAGRVNLRTFLPGQPIFRQNDRATAFYVVRAGTVDIEMEHPDTGDRQVLNQLVRGDSFGELGLLQATPRTATARATSDAELVEVDKGTFDRLLADAIDAPNFGLTLQAMAELRELPAYAHLSSEGLADVLGRGSWITVPPGEEILRQGDEGDAFYAIRSGRADVVRDGEPIATLGPGDYFGETALLDDAPRNATVTAHTPLRAFRLSREGFESLIAGAFRRKLILPPSDRDMEH